MTPQEYLLKCKIALGVKTDYALAKELDVVRGRISDWMAGRREIDDEGCAKIAVTLGLSLGEVLADVRLQGKGSDKSKEFWRSFLSALRQTAAIALLAIFSGSYANAPGPAFAGIGFKRGHWRP